MSQVEWIRTQVAELADLAHDPEAAHIREDTIHRVVLDVIADGADEPQALAAAAIETRRVEFPRWAS